MKILILYATTEGQTRKIARFVADELAGQGLMVELLAVGDAEGLDLARFDGAILAGSIHLGRYQKPLRRFVRAHAEALGHLPTLFLSVSLSAAGEDAEDWQGLEDCVARFTARTGWTPGRVEQVAGAFRFAEYDFFKSWMMRRIARDKEEAAPAAGEDREYTDWKKLRGAVTDWVGSLAGR